MSNTFWAVFFGSTLGTFTVHLAVGVVDEVKHYFHRKNVREIINYLDDSNTEDCE